MKPHKTLLLMLLIFCVSKVAFADKPHIKKDSLIINIGDKTKIVVYAEKKEDFRKILRYDLNALIRDMGAKIDTISSSGTTKINFDEPNAKKYLKDSTSRTRADDYIRIGVRGIHIKDGNEEVHISTSGIQVKDGNEIVSIGKNNEENNDNSNNTTDKKRKSWKLSNSDFTVSLGLNTYVGPNGKSPSQLSSDYDLRPFGSRYFAMAFRKKLTIAQSQSVALRLLSGFEFSWYNFMFEGNNVAQKGATQVIFPESAQSLEKSKLTVAYINMPLMPYIAFRRGAISHIGAGAFIGYRLDSYTKTKLAETGKKDHVHSNFYLNDFRYGFLAEIGFRDAPDVFFQYDANQLFASGRGPQLNAISFGIRL